MRPLLGAALIAVGLDPPGSQVGEELLGGRGAGSARPGSPDVDAGVVVGAPDSGSAARVDVDGGRHVELAGPGAVAGLPGIEETGEQAAVPRLQRGGDGVEGMGERAGDLVPVQVLRAFLDVPRVGLQPLVVGGGDAEAEHVDGLGLAAEGGGQLLRDEGIRSVRDLQRALDRVVVGDRHEVHPPPLGELVDLGRWRGALGQPGAPLDPELRELRGRRVAMEVGARCRLIGGHRCSLSRFIHSSGASPPEGPMPLSACKGAVNPL